ncbi:MAG TPA: hypothetical protein VFK02_35150 [Kofleriaceae bacterium]|nr:hypothetical protein [Kofleriaceae bacterium]
MQQRGAAAAVILTQPFEEVLDRIMSYYQADQPLPRIVIEHPLQNVAPEVLAQRASRIADEVERMLEGVA